MLFEATNLTPIELSSQTEEQNKNDYQVSHNLSVYKKNHWQSRKHSFIY